jgi:hypothetical protein
MSKEPTTQLMIHSRQPVSQQDCQLAASMQMCLCISWLADSPVHQLSRYQHPQATILLGECPVYTSPDQQIHSSSGQLASTSSLPARSAAAHGIIWEMDRSVSSLAAVESMAELERPGGVWRGEPVSEAETPAHTRHTHSGDL